MKCYNLAACVSKSEREKDITFPPHLCCEHNGRHWHANEHLRKLARRRRAQGKSSRGERDFGLGLPLDTPSGYSGGDVWRAASVVSTNNANELRFDATIGIKALIFPCNSCIVSTGRKMDVACGNQDKSNKILFLQSAQRFRAKAPRAKSGLAKLLIVQPFQKVASSSSEGRGDTSRLALVAVF